MPQRDPAHRRVRLLNVDIDDISMDELLEVRHGAIATLHADMLVKLQQDEEFHDIWPTFDIVTCDSQVLFSCLKLMGRPVTERVSGSDYFPRFYARYADDPSVTIFLLGAAPGIAATAAERINAKVGRTMVVDTLSPPFDLADGNADDDACVDRINASGATVLLVALGAGRQETWIARHRERLPGVDLFLPLGGTIDYEADAVRRPPPFVTRAGLEWLWRLVREPRRRFRRYVLHDTQVLPHLYRDARGRYRDPFPVAP